MAMVCKSEKLSYGLWIQNVYLTTPLQTPEKPQLENNEKGVLAKWNPIDNAKNYVLVVSEITNREVYETRLINDDEFSVMENTVPYSGSILFTQNGNGETTLFSEPLSDLKFLCIGSGAFGTSDITVEGAADVTDWASTGAPTKGCTRSCPLCLLI